MKLSAALIAIALATFPQVSAHYRFQSLILNGVTTTAWQYVRQSNNSNSPITDVTSTNMRCNSGGASGGSTQTATVAAGASVGFALDQAIYHHGVSNAYMTKVSSASTADGSSGWFKIWQSTAKTDGGNTITFPDDNATKFTFSIPRSIPSGDYLLHIEHIALHSAGSSSGAQFYISCAQLTVTGGGSASPATVSIPGVYKASDPGILINIYYPIPKTYVQPGPAVFSG